MAGRDILREKALFGPVAGEMSAMAPTRNRPEALAVELSCHRIPTVGPGFGVSREAPLRLLPDMSP
jgi:hypothetical protein